MYSRQKRVRMGGADIGNANIFTAIVTINHPLFGLVHFELVKIQNGKQFTNISHTLLAILDFDYELVMF